MLIALLDLIDGEENKNKFRDLYFKYENLVMWIALHKLHDHYLAEEAAQETWFYIAKNFKRIGEVDSLETRSYISTIADGFAISKFRKESKVISLETVENLNPESMYDSFFNSIDITELKLALDKIDDEGRNLLYLTYVYGYTSKEIAEMYHLTPANVRKRIQFAKEKVRNYFKDDVDG